MRTIWNVIAVVCFLNIVALIAGVGWLFNSGRIDDRRIADARMLFLEPTAARDAREADEQKQLEEQVAAGEIPSGPTRPPLTAEEQLRYRLLDTAADAQRNERMQRVRDDLRGTIASERKLLDGEWAELKTERADFKLMREEIARIEGSLQFRKALATLEGQKPKIAREMLDAMLKSGKREEVVSYLAALDELVRAKVIEAFVKAGDAALAAELLEALRTKGIERSQRPEDLEL